MSVVCGVWHSVVFLNSPYRETSKNVLKKKQEKKSAGGLVGLGFS
jgi:hypothetical protein